MPRRSTGEYPPDWKEIAKAVKDKAGWRCVRCGRPHDPASGHTLTCHHLDMDPGNCRWWNIPALCQKCHLSIQSRVVLERPWVLEHSEWFLPYLGGWSAWFYLGLELSREEVMADLDYYANVQRAMLLNLQACPERDERRKD